MNATWLNADADITLTAAGLMNLDVQGMAAGLRREQEALTTEHQQAANASSHRQLLQMA